MNIFDDLTREVAKGTSRRDVLRRLGAGLAGMLLVSLGVKKAGAAVSCGTCQACDLDTLTCGLPCSPASAGQTLCTMASSDGSYLRLASHLTNNGFASVGVSDSILLYQSGALFQSVLATNFQNPSVPGEIAFIAYAVSPQGSITPLAVVLQSGIPSYALSVDYDGRIVQTAATHTSNSSEPDALPQGAGGVQKFHPHASTTGIYRDAVVSPETCDIIIDIVAGVVVLGAVVCYAVGAAACAAEAPATALLGVVPCSIAVGALCGLASYGAVEAAKATICTCPLNEQNCNGVCCGPCMDCLNNTCVPNVTCSRTGMGPCCGNNQCCAEGLICDATSNTCTSPDSSCDGAFCGSFTDCNVTEDCQCYTIAEGGGQCAVNSFCDEIPTCSTSADCGSGYVCAIGSCCDIPVCLPICTPTVDAARHGAAASKGAGRRMSAHR
jgi:hypothetical protein